MMEKVPVIVMWIFYFGRISKCASIMGLTRGYENTVVEAQ